MSVELELKIWTECLEMSCLIVEKKIEELVFGVVDFFGRQGKGTIFAIPQFFSRHWGKNQIPTRTKSSEHQHQGEKKLQTYL